MEKVIRKLKLFGATVGLATSIVCTSPVVVHAEEEVLWENDKDDHHEEDINNYQPDNSIATPTPETPAPAPTQQITIDASNWDPKSEPNAGLEIPDYVQTEAERKGLITPTPETPTPETPTPETPTPETPTPETPTPETPTPETPTPEAPSKPEEPKPIPKTGQTAKNVVFALASGLAFSTIALIIIRGLGFCNDEKALDIIYKEEEKEEEENKLLKK